MADAGSIATLHSGPGRRTDSTVGGAVTATARLAAATLCGVPGWGWWTVPTLLPVTPPLLRQLPAQWWQAGVVSALQSRRCPGLARLSGTVTVSGSPASRWVMICERRTLDVIAVTKSAADGTWQVNGLDAANELYVAVALDTALNVVGLDRLTAITP